MKTHNEKPEDALARIQAMGWGKNDALAIVEFSERGIDPAQIDPRENVLTFRAWKAKGRQVARGATGVVITTWIPCKPTRKQEERGEEKETLRPKMTRLFHVSQTVPLGAKDSRPDAWNNPALVKAGSYEPIPQCHELPDGFEEVKEFSTLVDESECICPLAGVVTHVDCPIHGRGMPR